MRRGWLLVLLFWVAGCGRDPGRDLNPTVNATGAAPAQAVASSGIIPLEQVSKSQAAVVSQHIANTEITITYNRPVARGRQLFGALVPFGQVWNPGADQATAMAVTRAVHVNKQPLQAGKYSVWAIPGRESWTIIFSRAAEVFHTPYPGESQDALRLEVQPEQGPHMEVLCFYFPKVEGKDAELRLHWGSVMIPLAITVS